MLRGLCVCMCPCRDKPVEMPFGTEAPTFIYEYGGRSPFLPALSRPFLPSLFSPIFFFPLPYSCFFLLRFTSSPFFPPLFFPSPFPPFLPHKSGYGVLGALLAPRQVRPEMVKLLIPFLQTKFDHQTLVGGGRKYRLHRHRFFGCDGDRPIESVHMV